MTNTKILTSCSEGDLSAFFACKLRYCTGVWPFGRIERVRNGPYSLLLFQITHTGAPYGAPVCVIWNNNNEYGPFQMQCSMFDELERNKIIIYAVRIIRASTVLGNSYCNYMYKN